MKHIAVGDFLTADELRQVIELWNKLHDTGRFAAEVERLIIAPNMERINAAIGQENNARYLAYMVEFACMEAARTKETLH